jgi:hypothetical protein
MGHTTKPDLTLERTIKWNRVDYVYEHTELRRLATIRYRIEAELRRSRTMQGVECRVISRVPAIRKKQHHTPTEAQDGFLCGVLK